jgi:hypothetical protein
MLGPITKKLTSHVERGGTIRYHILQHRVCVCLCVVLLFFVSVRFFHNLLNPTGYLMHQQV